MPAPCAFDYAIVRVVPCLERGECVNVGVLVHAAERRFVGCRIALDRARLRAFAPALDGPAVSDIERHLEAVRAVAAGDPAAGPLAALPPSERFHWLVAPRSTIVQTSPVHIGVCDDPAVALEDLFTRLVAPAGR